MERADTGFDEAMNALSDLPDAIVRFVGSIGGFRSDVLKSDAILSAHIQRAYFEFTALEQVRTGIFELCL